ncbi:MAG TPA: hypothetical protein VLL31_06000 [Sulfurovum sp.]|nr:hypothetical protein [Sulfurovum sp.]
MSACRKCNNTNVIWNGGWKQCVSCGEVYERESIIVSNCILPSQKHKSLADIASLPLKSTLIGKLISRFHLMR